MNIENYMQENEHITIPMNWMPTEFYTVTFEGWKKFTFDTDNPTINEVTQMASKTLDCLINLYKDKYAFTDPQLGIKSDGTFYIKIGTLEKEEYERRMESQSTLSPRM